MPAAFLFIFLWLTPGIEQPTVVKLGPWFDHDGVSAMEVCKRQKDLAIERWQNLHRVEAECLWFPVSPEKPAIEADPAKQRV